MRTLLKTTHARAFFDTASVFIVAKAQEFQCCSGAKLINYSVPFLFYPSAITAVEGLTQTLGLTPHPQHTWVQVYVHVYSVCIVVELCQLRLEGLFSF